jgi:isocitrate dehydrogenase (NAD+)
MAGHFGISLCCAMPALRPGDRDALPQRRTRPFSDTDCPVSGNRSKAVFYKDDNQMSHTIAVIRGDGIGPEIMDATLKILDALQLGFSYEFVDAGMVALEKHGELLPQVTLDTIKRLGVALKSPLTTPVGEGFSSVNVELRKRFDLYANVRPAISFPNTKSRYSNIDLITVRENTEGAYIGEGQTVSPDGEVATLTQKITRKGSERIVRYAFELARSAGRKKVTLVHKANILKSTSGLFLKVGREIAKQYPDIECAEMIVDNTCMQLVMRPEQFDIICTTNLFGDIVSDLCAGLVGGLGLAPGANIGAEAAIFEAVHGSAPDIAGKGIANPCALLLGAAQMLGHLGHEAHARRLRGAIVATMEAKDRLTPDLGGTGSTQSFAEAIASRL